MSKKNLKRITVKIGTRVLTNDRNEIDRSIVKRLAGEAVSLMEKGVEVIIVSSGAIGSGLGLLKLERKHRSLSELQAAASVGQTRLMDIYNEYFGEKGYIAGQILVTQEDFNDRRRFLNIKYTINTLLKYKAVPVINENDSISTEEIKCGDNDRLSYLVADLAGADALVILTDVDGLYDGNGTLVKRVEKITDEIRAFCRGKGCAESTGGMVGKLEVAANAARAGITCVIAGGRNKGVMEDIAGGKETGTLFEVSARKINARKRWIAYGIKSRGQIAVDEGAVKAVAGGNKSLLPSGILGVSGKFDDGDVVDIVDAGGKTVARGLTNYSSGEIEKIKGLKTNQIEKELGYKDYDEVVHRDNLAVLDSD